MIVLKRIWWVGVALLGCAIHEPVAASSPPSSQSGIVVEEVRAGTAGQKAGLQKGDVLVSWRRDPLAVPGLPAAGELALPFDLVEVLLEQMPRARVTLLGRRGSETASWVLPQGAPFDRQGIRTAPLLSGELLASHQAARARLKTAGLDAGVAALRSMAAAARSRGDEDLAAWFLVEAARELARERWWEEADALFGEVFSLESPRRKPALAAQLYREWGDLLHRRLEWDRALESYELALQADRRKGFDSLSAAWSLAGLGLIEFRSGGAKDEETFFREAVAIHQRLVPASADRAMGWLYGGHAAAQAYRWADAIQRYREAVAILEQHPAGRLELARTLANLAYVQGQHGDAQAARDSWKRAYALASEEAPEDSSMAGITQGLGVIAARDGDLPLAEKLLTRSLELARHHQPGGPAEADALNELGLLQGRAGKRELGAQHLCQAVDVLMGWREKLRRSEDIRNRWGQFFAYYHRDCAEALVDLGRREDAFAAVEKGRARAFLDLRAERERRLAALSPEHAEEWRQLSAEYERVQGDLVAARARKDSPEQVRSLEGRQREIGRRKERLLDAELPAGAIRYPEPLSLAEARRRLEPGTVLLSYSVGRKRTTLFVLSPEGAAPGWTAVSLEIGSDELNKEVERFRKTLVKDRFNRRAFAAQSKALYKLLVAPAEPHLAQAERIVLSPDGPLHLLPFAALLRGDQYLVEWKPLYSTLSATVHAELLAQRRPPGTPAGPAKLVAFGDPFYSSAPPGRTREGAAPLPDSRPEVEAIADLFPSARIVLGAQVTEERVKETVRGASVVHFAVHGELDESSPVNSALLLSPSQETGAGDDGRLQAWEVMESLPLDADLVTLSACNTALGRAIDGEGLVGLTRAFQYAGARSVVATLWEISDRSTAGFMKTFYGALKEGKTKDEALRAAQIAQIRSEKPQPFYWAAFQLFGDWR